MWGLEYRRKVTAFSHSEDWWGQIPLQFPCNVMSAGSTFGNSHTHKSVAPIRFGFSKIVGQTHGQRSGKCTSLCITYTTGVEDSERQMHITICSLVSRLSLWVPLCPYSCTFYVHLPFSTSGSAWFSPTPDTEATFLHRHLINIHNYIRYSMWNTFFILYCSKWFWFSDRIPISPVWNFYQFSIVSQLWILWLWVFG